MKKTEPYTDKDGEARELDDAFFKTAKRGRPVLPEAAKRVRINVTLDPDVAAELRARPINASQLVNALLRKDLGLE